MDPRVKPGDQIRLVYPQYGYPADTLLIVAPPDPKESEDTHVLLGGCYFVNDGAGRPEYYLCREEYSLEGECIPEEEMPPTDTTPIDPNFAMLQADGPPEPCTDPDPYIPCMDRPLVMSPMSHMMGAAYKVRK